MAVNTTGIDTTEVDEFRQGVELTQQKHFDAGTVKVHSGEEGHELQKAWYGQDKILRQETFYQDLDNFDPVKFIQAQESQSSLFSEILTFPIIVGDNNQQDNLNFDGVIEPLAIREVASFFSVDVPFIAHSIKGSPMLGNTNINLASDSMATVYEHSVNNRCSMFFDLSEMLDNQHTLNGLFELEQPTISSFVDRRLVLNFHETMNDVEMQAATSLMTGSTDNYVGPSERSATSGWTYDNSLAQGTDSIAFGGFLY